MIFKINPALCAALFGLLLCFPFFADAQTSESVVISAESLADDKSVALDKVAWKYRAGDDAAWAAKDFDDSAWEQIQNTRLDPQALPASGWNGRAWFRLHFKVNESAADKTLALVARQIGASEVFLDGNLLVRFGEIYDNGENEYNPNTMPIPFKVGGAGEHILAVRYSASVLSDLSRGRAAWLANGGAVPGFVFSITDADDLIETIHQFASNTSMRPGIFFFGVLIALAFLHFLLFMHYRAERANLFYSIYAASFAVNILCGNLLAKAHQGVMPRTMTSLIAVTMTNISFVALLAFLHVAFRRRFGIVFWIIASLCAASVVLSFVYLGKQSWAGIISGAAVFGTITYSIYLLVRATMAKRPGAYILMGGMQIFALGMLSLLLRQVFALRLPEDFWFFGEVFILLGVPVAVSIYLARNFARTNRDLQARLEEVKQLSEQKIEHERHAAELRVENERRAKELEEARQLQLSMLPKTLPQIANLEIAAFMKPATEVGGDYYDFYISADNNLTIAVGDATGHGLKAGTMVTATKSLFNNLAPEPVLPDILKSASVALKKMNLRGMFMAMTMARIIGNRLQVCQAGMPSALLFRRETGAVEEFTSKALPLGAPLAKSYLQQETVLAPGDCLVIMSDGFPEMFNERGEMLGFDKAVEVLPEIAHLSPQKIINRFIEIGEQWAGARAQDDDVTLVVLQIKAGQ